MLFTYVIQAIFHSRIRTAYLERHISPKLAKTHITPSGEKAISSNYHTSRNYITP